MSSCDKEKKTHKVVISGIAGRFPKSDNVAEFQENLLNKVDCTTTDHGRWEYGKSSYSISVFYNISCWEKKDYVHRLLTKKIFFLFNITF